MKAKLVALLPALVLSGCVTLHAEGHLYPVQGPLTADAPIPVYKLTLSDRTLVGANVSFRSGDGISATVGDGEICQGTLQELSSDDPTVRSMEADWDRVFGQGFFVANVLGIYAERSTLIGSNGTQITLQMYNKTPISGVLTIVGVARDNRGGLYKITF